MEGKEVGIGQSTCVKQPGELSQLEVLPVVSLLVPNFFDKNNKIRPYAQPAKDQMKNKNEHPKLGCSFCAPSEVWWR